MPSLLAVSWNCHAQTARFKHYSTDEGFTGAGLKTIAQDSIGFLWVSTGSGLYRFDGYNFKVYRPRANDTLSLPQEILRSIWVDHQGRLWIGFPDRISTYNHDTDGFITYKVPTGGSFPESMCFDDQTIWLGGSKSGLVKFDRNRGMVNVYNIPAANKDLIVREIKNEGSSLLLGTSNGLWRFHKGNSSFARPQCDPADSSVLFSGNLLKILPHDGHYWFWINQSLVKVNSRFSIVRTLDFKTFQRQFDVEKKFDNLQVISIEQDADGILWLASQGLGLIRLDPSTDQLTNFRNDTNDLNSLPSDVLNHVMLDRDKNIWITTLNKGIAKLHKQSLHFTNYLTGKSTTGIVLLHGLKEDYLVAGTNGNGLWSSLFNSKKLDRLDFRKLEMSTRIKGLETIIELFRGRNRLWIGTLHDGVFGLPINEKTGSIEHRVDRIIQHDPNNPNTLSDNFITALWEVANGHLWAGTFGSGLNEIDVLAEYGTPGSVTKYRFDSNDSTSIIGNGVVDLSQQDANTLLISTFNGLDRLHAFPTAAGHPIEHIIKNISAVEVFQGADGTLYLGSKTGLLEGRKVGNHYSFTKAPIPGNPFITSIQEDLLGRIWCSSFDGLFFYDRQSQFVLPFKREDGLPSSRTVSSSGSAQTQDGIMIFANAEGITLFDPLSLRINNTKPKPVLVQLKINNKVVHTNPLGSPDGFTTKTSIHTLKELVLDHTQNILTLEFSAMDFTAPEKNQYQYMLEGFESEWVSTTSFNRTATYTNLRPDTYVFKIRASNRDGVWNNNITELKIQVLPPPWKTWWAYSLYGLVLTGILFMSRRNIIQHERLAGKLKLEHLELEKVREIDRTKTNFFANISHEFRTPLTLIQGPVQHLLDRFKKDLEVKTQLTLIQQNSDRLLRLVNQILELARLESGNLKTECVDESLTAFLGTVTGSFESLAIQKRISLIRQPLTHEIRAIFDKDKLEKIISNLISNAIKFTPEHGAIIISASLAEERGGKTNLVVRVTDTGRGIPLEQQDKVFERFYQVSEDGNQNAGTGIGLALSKELAEFLGGTLTLETKMGEGCKFTLTLPVQVTGRKLPEDLVVTETSIPEGEIISSHNGLDSALVENEKPILLIVEDHHDLRKFIIFCLGSDYNFLEASNGKEGLRQAIDQVPALILSDVMMPEMDGIEMCNKIKQDHRTNHIPVIILTAKANDESKLSGLGTGADDYLVKPFNKEELILKIKNQIATRVRLQEKIRLELLSESTTVKAVSADEVFLDRIKKIIESHISDERLSVEALADEAGLSRVQLYRKVLALTGMSANEFIRKLRLQRAAQLLNQRWGSVSQVAYEVGFSNLSYFSKCFKEQFGLLPSEYLLKSN